MWSALSKDLAEFTQNIRSDTGTLVGAVARITTEAATRLKGGRPFAGDDAFTESSCLLFDDGAAGDQTLLALQESDATYLRPLHTDELVAYNKWNPEQRNLCDSREIQQELLDHSDAVYERYLNFVVCGADEEEAEFDPNAEMDEELADEGEEEEEDYGGDEGRPSDGQVNESSTLAVGASKTATSGKNLENTAAETLSKTSSPLKPLIPGETLPDEDLDEIPLDHDVFFTRYFFRLRELRRSVGITAEARRRREEEQQRRQRAAASAGVSSSYASAPLHRSRDHDSDSSDWDEEGDAAASRQKAAPKGAAAVAHPGDRASAEAKNQSSLSKKRQAEIMAMIRDGVEDEEDDGSDAWDDCDLAKKPAAARNDGSDPQCEVKTDSSSNATMITNTTEVASPNTEADFASRDKALAAAQERIAELEATVRRLEAELAKERQKHTASESARPATVDSTPSRNGGGGGTDIASAGRGAIAPTPNQTAAPMNESPGITSRVEPHSSPSAPSQERQQEHQPASRGGAYSSNLPSFLNSPEAATHHDPALVTHSTAASPSNPVQVPQEKEKQTLRKDEAATREDGEEDDWSGWA